MLAGRWLSPLRRNIIEPLVSIRNGSPLRKYWGELEATQFLPEAVLRERQWEKLKGLLRFAAEQNEFYRKRFESHGITPAAITSPDDLRLIPALTKEDIRGNMDLMISRGFQRDSLMHFKTGGSTGKSLDIFITEECSELRNACARRHDRWTGWEVGEPVAAVWGNPHLPVTLKEKVKNSLLAPLMFLDTMSISPGSVRDFAREWQRVRPTLLFGHAHSIYLLARYVQDLKITTIAPKGILSTSMMLYPHERQCIEGVFGVKVTDRYGCEEVSLIASECERHEGMHINIEHLYVEFIRDDGTPAAAGEPGKIVVTDLVNKAMPFIRYQVEDVGVPSIRRCSCGRGLPLMESVTGRVADFLMKRDGAKVAGISLIENTLTKMPGINQMQIVQEKIDRFAIRVVPGTGFDFGVEGELVDYFTDVFGAGVSVTITQVDAIAPEPSGKYRFSICRL
jgi:phenylacetate-CoA ligase